MAWSLFIHDDLPPLPGRSASAPLGHPLVDGQVHGGIPPLPPIEAERIDRQGKVAKVVRHAADQVPGSRRRMLRDRALLVEVADSSDEVLELLSELKALGVDVERKG